jgi:parvulin-like peptidyl-prolyl isomerase
MIKKNLIFVIFFLNLHCFSYSYGESIIIKFKVNKDLITNYDIIKEAKYLTALNKELININKSQILELAKNSLVREKIKMYEIEKYYEVNYEAEAVDVFIDDIMKKNGFEYKSNFEIYLEDNETNLAELRKKLVIEQTWNKMIFDIYKDRIKINEEKISKTLESLINEKKVQKSFYLKEIVFSEKNKDNFDKKYNEIILSVKNLGFEKTALIHSISNTSKNGGTIGWINQNQLSKKILTLVKNLELDSYTKPINTAGGSIILKLTDVKEISMKEIDKETELSKIISDEKNRQLNEFSVIHYKKTENKSYVKKF